MAATSSISIIASQNDQAKANLAKFAVIKAARIGTNAEEGRLMVLASSSRAVVPDSRADLMLAGAIERVLAAKHMAEGKEVCPGCNGIGVRTSTAVHVCLKCLGLFTSEPITRPEAMRVVRLDQMAVGTLPADSMTYFDLDILEADGRLIRVHGWKRNSDGKVIQWG
mgnify:CR=1 FL=1